MFTFVDILQRQRQSPSNVFTRLLSLQYEKQDRAGNGDSQKIQSVMCEDTLHVKRIITV